MKIPRVEFYVADFVAYTHHLTDAQVGKIIRFLCRRAMGFPVENLPENLNCAAQHAIMHQDKCIASYVSIIERNQHIASTRRTTRTSPDSTTPVNLNLNLNLNQKEKKVRAEKYSLGFENFWKFYPKNDGSKFKAAEAYRKAIGMDVSEAMLELKAKSFAAYIARTGIFVPHAATWLSEHRWETDYEGMKGNINGVKHSEKPAPKKNKFPTTDELKAKGEL